jgi:hypothetical protein
MNSRLLFKALEQESVNFSAPPPNQQSTRSSSFAYSHAVQKRPPISNRLNQAAVGFKIPDPETFKEAVLDLVVIGLDVDSSPKV